MLRVLVWFFRTPTLALFRVFVFSWLSAGLLVDLTTANLSSVTIWQLVAGAAFLLAGGVSAAWAASHHPARKWTGYLVEGLLFTFVINFFVPTLWWTVPLMIAGAVLAGLYRRYPALQPLRILAPVGRFLVSLAGRVSAPPRRAVAALRTRLSRSAREQRRTDRTFNGLVATLNLDSTHNRGR